MLNVAVSATHDHVGKRFESLLAGDLGTRTPFGAVRKIEVVESFKSVGRFNISTQFRCQLSLRFYQPQNCVRLFGQLPQTFDTFFDRTDLFFIEIPGLLFAISCDKGNGVAVIEQRDDIAHLLLSE